MFNKSKQIDLLTIKQELQRLGKLEEIGGVIYLTSVMSNVASTANIEHHCFLINEKWIGRELARAGLDLYKHSMDSMKDPFEVMEETNQTLSRINQLVFKKQFEALPKILSENITELHRRMALKTGITGIPSSIRSLDIVTAGWQKQDLIIIAARPGMGKTAFALLCAQASAQAGYPVAVFSLEMSSQQLVFRLQSMESGVDSQKIKTGKLTDFELEKIVEASVAIENLPMHLDDTAGLSVLEFRAKVARMTHEHGIKFIVVDYIQLMKGDDGGNREQEIASISRALKGIAKEYDIPVMVLAQLSRAVESRKSKVPMLSDLRESGAVEQDADLVIFPFRPEYYEEELMSDSITLSKGMAELHIAKHRNGSCVPVVCGFEGSRTKFYCLDTGINHQDQIEPEKFKRLIPSDMYNDDSDNTGNLKDVPF
jgi:replicative DNA helicase